MFLHIATYTILLKKTGMAPSLQDMLDFYQEQNITIHYETLEDFMRKGQGAFDEILSKHNCSVSILNGIIEQINIIKDNEYDS